MIFVYIKMLLITFIYDKMHKKISIILYMLVEKGYIYHKILPSLKLQVKLHDI